MSPIASTGFSSWQRFPRVSGDEPVMDELGIHAYEFSPRERG